MIAKSYKLLMSKICLKKCLSKIRQKLDKLDTQIKVNQHFRQLDTFLTCLYQKQRFNINRQSTLKAIYIINNYNIYINTIYLFISTIFFKFYFMSILSILSKKFKYNILHV